MKKSPIYITILLVFLLNISLTSCASVTESDRLEFTAAPFQSVTAQEDSEVNSPSPLNQEELSFTDTPFATAQSITATPTTVNNPGEVLTPTEDLRPNPDDWRSWPVIPAYISERAKQIYRQGLVMGNDPNSFSVTGDCQAIRDVMLGEFDDPRKYNLKSEELHLQETIDAFQGSFNRNGIAVRGGFTAASVLSPIHADPQYCKPGETPLGCEFRLHNPSILIVSLEVWNDRANLDRYELYVRQIIEYSIEQGVLPILATKADMAEALEHVINPTLVRLAYEYDIPLWNFWLAAQPLPNHGIDPDRDGFHISEEAWKVKSFSALNSLDAVWRTVRHEQDLPTPTFAVTATLEPTATPHATEVIPTATPIPVCNPPDDCVILGITRSIGGRFEAQGIYLLDTPTGEMAQVAGEGYRLQTVSSDGKRMLINQGSQLFSANVDGTDLVLITETFYGESDQGAYWMAGDETIVLVDQRTGQNTIWLYQINSGSWKQITTDQDQPSSLYPSASQGKVYWKSEPCYESEKCEGDQVWASRIADGFLEKMESVIQPVFSPDDVHLAFMDPMYTYTYQFGANFKLLVEDVEIGLTSRRMVTFPAATGFQVRNQLEDYVWSPDSSRLMIFLDERSNYYERSAGYHTFLFILSNGLLLEYDRLFGEAPRMAWAPDSMRMLFAYTITGKDSYAVQLVMLDTTTRLVHEYTSPAILQNQDYLLVDKMFWLPSQVEK